MGTDSAILGTTFMPMLGIGGGDPVPCVYGLKSALMAERGA